ncbi:unnamed protein product, partial [Rotaria sp. Silwood2]
RCIGTFPFLISSIPDIINCDFAMVRSDAKLAVYDATNIKLSIYKPAVKKRPAAVLALNSTPYPTMLPKQYHWKQS